MSLYGALFSGVSGLKAQSNKIGVISDNISNVNTVAYKGSTGMFESLVTSSSVNAAYSPGGVLGSARGLVSKQGLIQATDSPTDIAIQGNGFFVVNQQADQSGSILYSRAGSFRADSTGNFQNAAGFFLQAWPLDREGRLPGEPGNINTISSANLASLRTVNVSSLTGVAAATTNVSVSANLKSSQAVFPGAGVSAEPDPIHNANDRIAAHDILIPDGSPAVNGIARGDKFNISTGAGLSYNYRYGGFTFSRSVIDGTGADSGVSVPPANVTLSTPATTNFLANPIQTISTTGGTTVVRVTLANNGLTNNDAVTLSNIAAFDGLTAPNLNGQFAVSNVTTNTFDITVTGTASLGGGSGGGSVPATLAHDVFRTNAGSPDVYVRQVGHGLSTGDVLSFNGVGAAIGGIGTGALNSTYVVTVIDADHYRITTSTNASATTGGTQGAAVKAVTRPFTGKILDASTETDSFLSNGPSGFTADGLKFKITTATSGVVEFTYASAPVASNRTFNNMTNLAEAINGVNGLTARVNNGKLYVGALNANEAITFENGSTVGVTGASVQSGIDWVTELGLSNLSNGVDRFSSLQGLKILMDSQPGVSATIESPLSASTLSINVDDPLDTITFTDRPPVTSSITLANATPFHTDPATNSNGFTTVTVTMDAPHGYTTGDIVNFAALPGGAAFNGIPRSAFTGNFEITVTGTTTYTIRVPGTATPGLDTGVAGLQVTPPTNAGSLLSELKILPSLNSNPFAANYSAPGRGPVTVGPQYDPADPLKNMASGAIAAQFSRPMRVFDALGTGHDLNMSFIKIGTNTWAVEVYAIPASDITTSLPNGQITSGTVTFNGDSSLRSVSASLANAVNVDWTNGASPSAVTFNWGTAGQPFGTVGAASIGKTDGLSQFDSNYRVNFVNQNGAPVGELTGVSIDENGYVVVNYSNGETQKLFKIPLADFANPDQLNATTGNVYSETSDSGEVNLVQAGSSGVGKIAASSLEASNVELADQLTDMIVAQRAYQACTKVITTADSLLEQLNQIGRS